MPKYNADTMPICVQHDKTNEVKTCTKCHIVYCAHFASLIDQRFCANCMGDVEVKVTIMEKIEEHIRADGSVSFSRKYQARHIKLEGTDWLFAAANIGEMSDNEIEANIEYHRANVSLMLQERESRKLEKFKKLASVKITTPKQVALGASTTKTKTPRAAKKSASNPMADVLAAISTLMRQGKTQEEILKIIGGQQNGK